MADVVDDDTIAMVQQLWLSSPTLTEILDRAPAADTAKSPRGQPLQLPYGTIACEHSPGRSQRYVNGTRKDVRRVVISVWGTHEQANAALQAMEATFHARLSAPGYTLVGYPSGAKFIKWWPVNNGRLVKETGSSAAKGGEDVWRATIEAEVTSVRSEP